MKKLISFLIVLLSLLAIPNQIQAKSLIRLHSNLDTTATNDPDKVTLYEVTINGNDTTYTAVASKANTTANKVAITKIGTSATNKKDNYTFSFGNPGKIWFDVNTEDLPSTATYALTQDTKWGIGLIIGSKFKAYPNPNIYGSDVKVKSYTLRHQDVTAKKQSAANLKKLIDLSTEGITPSWATDYIVSFQLDDGVDNQFIPLVSTTTESTLTLWNATANSKNVAPGTNCGIMINSIEMFLDDGAPSQPADADIDCNAIVDNDIYRFFGETTVVPTTAQDNDFSKHNFLYYFGDNALTAEEFAAKSEANELTKIADTETIKITTKGVLTIASVGVNDDGSEAELLGNPVTFSFDPYDYIKAESFAAFTPQNNGQLMVLDFPLNMTASLCAVKATTEYEDKANRTLFARDLNGNNLKITISGDENALSDWINFGDFNDPTARTYAPAGTFKGLYQYRAGKPELVVTVKVEGENYVDYSPAIPAMADVVLTGDEAAGVAPEGLFAKYPTGKLINITPDMWGCIVTLNKVTATKNISSNTLKEFAFNDSEGNIISSYRLYASTATETLGSKYNLTGVIDYSADSLVISPLSVAELVAEPTITAESFTNIHADAHPIESDGECLEWHANTPGGQLKLAFDVYQPATSFSGKYITMVTTDMYGEDPTLEYTQGSKNSTGLKLGLSLYTDPNQPLKNASGKLNRLIARDGAYMVRMVVRVHNGTSYTDEVLAESDPIILKIDDDFANIPVYHSVADLLTAFKGKTAAEIGDNCYISLETPAEKDQNAGAFMVRDLSQHSIAISDAADTDGKNIVVVSDNSEFGWNPNIKNIVDNYSTNLGGIYTGSAGSQVFIERGSHITFRDDYFTTVNSKQIKSHRHLLPGDGITRLTAKVSIASGVVTLDATNISEYDQSFSQSREQMSRFESHYPTNTNPTNSQVPAERRYSYILNGYESIKEVEEPEQVTFKATDVNRIVLLKNVKLKSDNGNIAAATQGLNRKAVALRTLADEAETEVTPTETADGNYFAVTANDLKLTWDYMTSDADKALQQAEIATADNDATFTVRGLLLSDNAGGVKLEVLSLIGSSTKVFYLCEHPGHATYSHDTEIEQSLDGKRIELRGAKINRTHNGTEYVYSPTLKTTTTLDWDDADLKKAHCITIDRYYNTSTKMNLTGVVSFDESGNAKITVETLSAIDGNVPYTITLVAAPDATDNTFGADSRPTLMAVSKEDGKMHALSASTPIYYRMMTVENKAFGDKVEKINASSLNAKISYAVKEEFKDCTAEFKPYHQGVFALMNTSYIVQVVSCTPGIAAPFMQNSWNTDGGDYSYFFFEKVSTDLGTVTELIADNTVYHAINPDNNGEEMEFAGMYYLKNAARVVEVDSNHGLMTLTDGQSIVGVRYDASDATFRPGDYVENLPLERENHEWIYSYAGGPLSTLEAAEAPSVAIEVPEAKQVGKELTTEKGKYVKTLRAKFAGSDDEWTIAGNADADAAVMPATTHMGWNPADVNEDKEYVVTGIVMPRTPLTLETTVAAPADEADVTEVATDRLELWVLTATEVRATETPVITIATPESESDGVAVTTEDVTATLSCEEGARIEYSLNGGAWTPYTAPITIGESATIEARATIGDMYTSTVAKKTIRYEHYSGKVAFGEPDTKAGYTLLAIAPADETLANETYTIRYTTDGSEPTATSTAYTAPLEVDAATTVKAALFENGKRKGETLSMPVTVKSGNVKVSIVNDDNGTHVVLTPESNRHLASSFDIYYAFEGGDGQWMRYTAFIRIGEDSKIMAYMVERGKTDGDIVKVDITGITGVSADDAASVSVEGDTIIAPEGSEIYDLTGRRVRSEGLRSGIYIVRLPEGKAVKVAVK